MRLIFYLYLFSQLFNFIGVFAEKVREESSGLNFIDWEKVEENKSKPLKKIIWKSYDNMNFILKIKINKVKNKWYEIIRGRKKYTLTKTFPSITEIEPFSTKHF